VQLTQFFINRLKNMATHCTVLSALEQIAMEQAKQDEAFAKVFIKSTAGIPYGLKDLFAVKAPEPPTAHRHLKIR
jgi:Asp-tRNA(Asn)/Glu-tRNA(Gln) amidotransferase A subunit family amidase